MPEFEEQLKDVLSQAYDIERELGGGGMSRVFVATDRVLGRKIVIKLLSPELIADVNRGRFRREIKVAAQLQHPHIVPLLSAGEHGDLVYYTMPFIAGESLKQSVEKNGPMQVADVVRVLYHVGEALDYAHGQGVVHRDIKPANILRSGTYALVTDFGVAKALNASMPASGMTSTGMAIGTPAYMAPEQLAGEAAADHRIDIYALGLLAYELLNGRSPYAGTTPKKVLVAVLTEDPPPLIDVRPDVPRALSDIVMSCLSKEPDDRPATARALLNALDGFSTTSGEIRTQEHKAVRDASASIPASAKAASAKPVSTTPVSAKPVSTTPAPIAPVSTTPASTAPVSTTPVAEAPSVIEEPNPADDAEPAGYEPPGKSRTKLFVGAGALIIVAAAGAIYMLGSGGSSNGAASAPKPAPVVAESATVSPPPAVVAALPGAATLPAAVPESVASAPKVDSQAILDSLKRVAAAKKAAAVAAKAKADSLKRVAVKADTQKRIDPVRIKARSAAIWVLADPAAHDKLMEGATHVGGVLLKKRTGDLQTQINTLQPFLARAGITYDQFKVILQGSGTNVYDEFGRIVPDSLKKFTGVSHLGER